MEDASITREIIKKSKRRLAAETAGIYPSPHTDALVCMSMYIYDGLEAVGLDQSWRAKGGAAFELSLSRIHSSAM